MDSEVYYLESNIQVLHIPLRSPTPLRIAHSSFLAPMRFSASSMAALSVCGSAEAGGKSQ